MSYLKRSAKRTKNKRPTTPPTLPAHPALPKLAYRAEEVAQMFGVSRLTVYRLNSRGLLRHHPALRHKLFARSEIERFLNSLDGVAPVGQ